MPFFLDVQSNASEPGNLRSEPKREPVSGFGHTLVLASPSQANAGGGVTERTQAEYSDDFEDFAPTNRDGNDDDFDLSHLKKIVEHYSDDSDGGSGDSVRRGQLIGREPALKKYVERYSDEGRGHRTIHRIFHCDVLHHKFHRRLFHHGVFHRDSRSRRRMIHRRRSPSSLCLKSRPARTCRTFISERMSRPGK